MALTDLAIRNAKPGAKPIKISDAAGMFLLVTLAGGKLWRFKYRVEGREKLLSIGSYPEVSLSDARRRRDEAREQLAAGKDPSREKQRGKLRSRLQAENTFAANCCGILRQAQMRWREGLGASDGKPQRISSLFAECSDRAAADQ